MGKFSIGDLVARKSYSVDVYFKIVEIKQNDNGEKIALLKGLDVRLCADAPLNDLILLSVKDVKTRRQQFINNHKQVFKQILVARNKIEKLMVRQEEKVQPEFFNLPGRVLHVDGDASYLNLCLKTYKELKISAKGYKIPEHQQPQAISELLTKHMPDIIVLTGHDGLVKGKNDFRDLNSYRNSKYFVEAVKQARKFDNCKDSLVIFAGACQSHYEAILAAGANFASSPKRILIHAFDPVFIVEKLAYTPFYETVSMENAINSTVSGFAGIGGVETRGKFRLGMPKSPY